MQLLTFSLLISSLLAVCHAAPADNHALEPRQTFTVTCIGGRCDDPPDNGPTARPTTTKNPFPPIPPVVPPKPTPTKTTKTTLKPSPTQSEEVGPSSTRCPVPLYYKCGGWDGGKPWDGCTVCVKGAKCVVQNEWYYQCVADDALVGGEGVGL